jgi:hypothetical protein
MGIKGPASKAALLVLRCCRRQGCGAVSIVCSRETSIGRRGVAPDGIALSALAGDQGMESVTSRTLAPVPTMTLSAGGNDAQPRGSNAGSSGDDDPGDPCAVCLRRVRVGYADNSEHADQRTVGAKLTQF